MRLSTLTLFLSTFAIFSSLVTQVSSVQAHVFSRQRGHNRLPAPQALSSRQHRIARDLIDVCINVNVDLLANATQLLGLQSLLGPLNLGGDIYLCLCLKDLELYVETNDQLEALVGLLGVDTVCALISGLINTSPQAQQCTFPQHAHHTCTTADPCHYECDPPYVLEGRSCVCAPPYSSCNGICGYFPQGCGSATPKLWQKRDSTILTLAQARASCKAHETVCGISGLETTHAFECLDINTTTDSCGGCMAPHPFHEKDSTRIPVGKDCSSIPKAKTVSCAARTCVVHTCVDGWVPNARGSGCIVDSAISALKMLKVKRISTTSIGLNATLSTGNDLNQHVDTLMALIFGIEESINSTAAISSDTPLDSSIDPSLIDDVVNTLTLVMQSTTHASLHYSLKKLYHSERALLDALDACACMDDLSLATVRSDLLLAIEATVAFLTWCDGDGDLDSEPTSTTTHSYPQAPLSGSPPTSTLLSISVAAGAAATSSPISLPSITSASTRVSVLISPTTSKPTPATNLATISIEIGLDGVLSSWELDDQGITSEDDVYGLDVNGRLGSKIVQRGTVAADLGHLLDGLSTPGTNTNAVVDSLLEDALDASLDDTLDDLDLGRRDIKKGHQLQVTSDTTVVTNLGPAVNALVDRLLELHGLRSLLPSVTSALGLPPVTNLPTCSTSDLTQCLADNLVTATFLVLSSSSISALVKNSGELHSVSLESINALDSCSCIESDGLQSLYNYLGSIMHASMSLASASNSLGPDTNLPGGVNEPLTIGLRKLLRGLGLDVGPTNVVVGNILGNGLDHSLNSILDGLNIGPNGQ
ncbi:hypothetical protein CPC08DRAFT_393973 [Agrocybe pediades]|nr:hypothetical protein CPC08DRAFT_393973 [Agrocybe pediades]